MGPRRREVNRRLCHQAGLFYEGEVEVAGASTTRDPAQFKCGSLYAPCHSDKENALILKRSRFLDLAHFATNLAERSKALTKSGIILCIFVLVYDIYFIWDFFRKRCRNGSRRSGRLKSTDIHVTPEAPVPNR